MSEHAKPASGCTGPSSCSVTPVCLSVVLSPADHPECATMYALDQVMAELDRHQGWESAKPRIAQWFYSKYGQNV
jgi:hypothetical protein